MMHYRSSHDKPTYLFGENLPRPHNPNEIFLNKSGYVQVNQNDGIKKSNNQQYQYAKVANDFIPTASRMLKVENYKNISYNPKHQTQTTNVQGKQPRKYIVKPSNQKIESIISQNDARRFLHRRSETVHDQYYDRPGYLPVKTSKDRDSPPPITPILSPPPAFQDTKSRLRADPRIDPRIGAKNVNISFIDYENRNPKGMVFSRSFEYDRRKNNVEFNEIFSKSFDYDFKTNIILPENKHIGRQKSMTFSTLTGISPNYLTKRESFEKGLSKLATRSRDNSPLQRTKNFITKTEIPRQGHTYFDGNVIYTQSEATNIKNFTKYRSLDDANHGRSKRAQFTRICRDDSVSSPENIKKAFHSLDMAGKFTRLNSCDSGARSDFSNDDLDDEEEEQSSSLALSYKSTQQLTISSPESLRNLNRYSNTIPYTTQHQILMQKQRSLTPDALYDDESNMLGHTNLIKQRSLTPEKRSMTPEEKLNIRRSRDRLKNLDGSNSSLISKNNSMSRSSTLERHQKQRYDTEIYQRPEVLSRSSSSSSYSGDGHDNSIYSKRNQIRQITRNNTEYRIRRSRSLQLSERSPNRSAPHKVVVKLGGNIPNEQNNYAHLTQMVHEDHNNLKVWNSNNETYQTPRNIYLPVKDIHMDYDKSRSFEMECGLYREDDYDKSQSFENVYYDDQNSNQYVQEKPKLGKKLSMGNNMPIYRQESSGKHDIVYDVVKRRSPINEHNLNSRSREVSPSNNRIYRSMNRMNEGIERTYKDKSPVNENIIYRKERMSPEGFIQNPIEQSSPGSDFDGNLPDFDVEYDVGNGAIDAELIKEAELVTELLYGQNYKTDSYVNQKDRRYSRNIVPPAGTTSPGSCTASSCDFWPHCGISNLNTHTVQIAQSKSSDTTKKISNNNINSNSNMNNNLNNSINSSTLNNNSCNIINISNNINNKEDNANLSNDLSKTYNIGNVCGMVNGNFTDENLSVKELNNKIDKSQLNFKLTKNINSKFINNKNDCDNYKQYGKPKSEQVLNKSNSTIVFLGEREMPITKKYDYFTSSAIKSAEGSSSQLYVKEGLRANNTNMSSMDGKFQKNLSINSRNKQSAQSIKLKPTPQARDWSDPVVRSRSLPKSFLRGSSSSTDDPTLTNLFVPPSLLKLRAVSSPTLSENSTQNIKNNLDEKSQIKLDDNNTSDKYKNSQYNHNNDDDGVLQKFKKTLIHFNKSNKLQVPSVSQNIQDNTEPTKNRFGPLIWRSSKERKKYKHHRRNKCNSGDSGIQVELENDEVVYEGSDSLENSPSINSRVRRTNSAKLNGIEIKINNDSSSNNERMIGIATGRSFSQSSGLDQIDKSKHENLPSEIKLNDSDKKIYAEVLYTFEPAGDQELRLEKGALIQVLHLENGPWWFGKLKEECDDINCCLEGWFPKEFVRLIPQFKPNEIINDDNNCDMMNDQIKNVNISLSNNKPNHFSSNDNLLGDLEYKNNDPFIDSSSNEISPIILSSQKQNKIDESNLQNNKHFKENIIKELIDTEINYVKLLSSLYLGFVKEMRLRPDIFTNDNINTIFSNIEKIWRFQQSFLDALRTAVDNKKIADCFIKHHAGFLTYSTYCNCYPRALVELEKILNNKEARNVLESCRINENLPELPLSAHLLAPIQRLCRYPLHLIELVKHSPSYQEVCEELVKEKIDERIDCKEMFEEALNTMKKVTESVNEGKRHCEYLSRIQAHIDNFQGPPIKFLSSRLFLQTDAIRISPNLWNNTYSLFLFDHQLIYCKKDILKRAHFIYKGRIYLDNCRILNLPDGKLFGVTLKNALRIYCDTRNKWFDFCFRSSSNKRKFINTLLAERQYCGESLFITEIESGIDLENLSDNEFYRNNNDNDDDDGNLYEETGYDMNNLNNIQLNIDSNNIKLNKQQYVKYNSETLPKKTKKISKNLNYEYSTSSLGRKKLGNWFRKAKSTNSTPNHSPTHHPLTIATIVNSDNSSQNSLGEKVKNKIETNTVNTS